MLQLSQDRNRLVGVAREPDEARGAQPAPPCLGGIVGRQLRGQLVQLGPRRRGAATCCLLGGQLELLGDGCIGPVGGEREVAGPLLGVRHCVRQRSVHGPPLPDRRALVADRREQGMCEAHGRVVELDDGLLRRRLQCLEHAIALSVRRCQQLDSRPGERGDEEQDVERLPGKTGEAAAEQLVEAFRNAERLARGRPRVRPHELTAELEREERVSGGRLLHAHELWAGQLEPRAAPRAAGGRLPRLSGPTVS